AVLIAMTTDIDAETLYAAASLLGAPSDLLILNPGDGSVRCRVGPIGFGVTALAVNPVTGVLYGATGNKDTTAPGSLIVHDQTTGAGHVVATLPTTSPDNPVTFPDITFTSDGKLYGVLYNGTRSITTLDLWVVDVSTLSISKVSTSGFDGVGSGFIGGGGIAA